MRYFKANVKLGHMGKGNYTETCLYIYAKTMYDAIKFAQKVPAVKHSHLPISVQEISEEEYKKGIEKDTYKKTLKQMSGREL